MGWGTGNLGVGSGGGLNFKIVGNPQPANPKENTIWLNTDVDITGQYLQAEQPEEMAEGEVWISTGMASQVAFNALKKGTVMVYPLSAKQMVGGTLVDVTAKSWQNGEWVEWIPEYALYWNGDERTALTGGWVSDSGATVTKHSDRMTFNPGAQNMYLRTAKHIDLSNATTLCIEYTGGGAYQSFALRTFIDGNLSGTAWMNNATKKTVVTLDVSGISRATVTVMCWYATEAIDIYRIWAE